MQSALGNLQYYGWTGHQCMLRLILVCEDMADNRDPALHGLLSEVAQDCVGSLVHD